MPLKVLPMLFCFGLCCHALAQPAPGGVMLLDRAFEGLAPGHLLGVVGAHAEYHYLPECAPKGAWSVSAFTSEDLAQRAWRIVHEDGTPILLQTHTNTKNRESHPLVTAGDPLWQNYTFNARIARDAGQGRCGVVFRVRNDRCYYFFGVEGDRAVLLLVREGTGFRTPFEKRLADAPFTAPEGAYVPVAVRVEGNSITCGIGDTVLRAEDATFSQGGIGLLSDAPVRFSEVSVSCTTEEKAALDARIQAREAELRRLEEANPKPVLWKRIQTNGFGAGRNLRFGDLNGDGQMDVLIGQVRHHGPKDRNSELACLTAVTFDGETLWQLGEPDPWRTMLTNDVAFQIHDLDNDGRAEVVYCMDREIIVADGATGETLRRAPTPETPAGTAPPYDKFPRILGDSLFFCDLRGQGHPGDMLLKDRYENVWAMDAQFRVLWHARCNTGHYPFALDVDGDGKDEVALGYSLIDGDGSILWSLDKVLKDHGDGVALVDLSADGTGGTRFVCAASDEGFFIADLKGNILKHHYLGHIQNPAVGEFRDDLPGLETVTVNFWGNQGIIRFFDAEGDQYHDFEPFQHGSLCLPVNWTGAPPEFVALSANPDSGGLFDGMGRRVLRFPADGHPDLCYAVLDLTGDCRDEIVVWDPYEIWVYTQDDNPKPGRLYKPRRNAPWNQSNYQATVSLPAWSGEN